MGILVLILNLEEMLSAFQSSLLCYSEWSIALLIFLSERSVHWCLWGFKVFYYYCIIVNFFLYVCSYLLYIFKCSCIKGLYVNEYNILLYLSHFHFIMPFFCYSCFFFFLFRATPVAAGLCHSHSNPRSEPHLWPTPQLAPVLPPLAHWARPGIEPASSWTLIRFLTCWATTWTPIGMYLLPFYYLSSSCFCSSFLFISSTFCFSHWVLMIFFYSLPMFLYLCFGFFFSFSFLAVPRHMEFPGQGSEGSHSCNLCCSCSNARSLTHCAFVLGINPVSQRSRPIADPVAPDWELLFVCFVYLLCVFDLWLPWFSYMLAHKHVYLL